LRDTVYSMIEKTQFAGFMSVSPGVQHQCRFFEIQCSEDE